MNNQESFLVGAGVDLGLVVGAGFYVVGDVKGQTNSSAVGELRPVKISGMAAHRFERAREWYVSSKERPCRYSMESGYRALSTTCD